VACCWPRPNLTEFRLVNPVKALPTRLNRKTRPLGRRRVPARRRCRSESLSKGIDARPPALRKAISRQNSPLVTNFSTRRGRDCYSGAVPRPVGAPRARLLEAVYQKARAASRPRCRAASDQPEAVDRWRVTSLPLRETPAPSRCGVKVTLGRADPVATCDSSCCKRRIDTSRMLRQGVVGGLQLARHVRTRDSRS
jgi:hypothetical protein